MNLWRFLIPALAPLAFAGAPAHAANLFYDGVPKFSAGPNVTVDVRGRLLFDFADGDQDFALPIPALEDSEFRAARLGADIAFGERWKATAEFDFVGNDFQPADLLLAFSPRDGLTLTAGHFKEAFSLDELTSGRFTTFMERGSFTDAFDLSRRLGASVALGGERWSWTTALQAAPLDEFDMPLDLWGVSSRATVAPVLDEEAGRYVHLGAAVRWRDNGGAGEPLLRYRQRPMAHLSAQTVATPRFADSDMTWGLEAAVGQGAFHAEAEFAMLNADGPVSDADFSGGYVSAGWFLTGEHRTYEADAGKFDRVKPLRQVGQNGFGAIELAARYDWIDLNDGAIAGGDQTSLSLGLNWLPTARTRVTLNYVDADVDNGPFGAGDSEIVQTRLQIDW